VQRPVSAGKRAHQQCTGSQPGPNAHIPFAGPCSGPRAALHRHCLWLCNCIRSARPSLDERTPIQKPATHSLSARDGPAPGASSRGETGKSLPAHRTEGAAAVRADVAESSLWAILAPWPPIHAA
jgi:hypothetical protein